MKKINMKKTKKKSPPIPEQIILTKQDKFILIKENDGDTIFTTNKYSSIERIGVLRHFESVFLHRMNEKVDNQEKETKWNTK